jgi:hypothetical protein
LAPAGTDNARPRKKKRTNERNGTPTISSSPL